MKTFLSILFLICCYVLTFAQTGVNTVQPTETLDVSGTLRVRNLPSDKSVINTNANGGQGVATFKPTKTLLANENGVIGVANSLGGGGCTGNTQSNVYTVDNSSGIITNVLDFSNMRADDSFDCIYFLQRSSGNLNNTFYRDEIYLPRAPIDKNKIYTIKVYVNTMSIYLAPSKINSTDAKLMASPCGTPSCRDMSFNTNGTVTASFNSKSSSNLAYRTIHFIWFNNQWHFDMN